MLAPVLRSAKVKALMNRMKKNPKLACHLFFALPLKDCHAIWEGLLPGQTTTFPDPRRLASRTVRNSVSVV